MRYFITFSYDGTNYHGWQIQPNADSVQARLNDALTKLLPVATECVGAGRTDTGVHASMMVAHFDTDQLLDEDVFAFRLNRIVPADIAIEKVETELDRLDIKVAELNKLYSALSAKENGDSFILSSK